MKENKESKKGNVAEDNTHQKVYWIIGIAVIVFLILLFGSIIGLKITKDGLDGFLGKSDILGFSKQDQANYEVWEDGTKENISEGVTNAEFSFEDGIRVSHCHIIEREDSFSEISLDVENLSQERIDEKVLLVKLYDSKDSLITEFTMITSGLEPESPTIVRVMEAEPCAHAERIVVELQNTNNSGDM